MKSKLLLPALLLISINLSASESEIEKALSLKPDIENGRTAYELCATCHLHNAGRMSVQAVLPVLVEGPEVLVPLLLVLVVLHVVEVVLVLHVVEVVLVVIEDGETVLVLHRDDRLREALVVPGRLGALLGIQRDLVGLLDLPVANVLAGVERYFPLYREVSRYPHLVASGVKGNFDDASAKDLHTRAWAVVEPLFLKEVEEAVARYREGAGGAPTSACSRCS